MKKLSKILLLTLLLALSVLAIASCGGSDPVIEIALKEDAMPQLQFVVGEELDLSAGVLLVTEDGTTTEIPMNSPDVTVTGYNKSKAGNQEVTLTYKGESVTVTVKVVERMVAIDFETDYLIGDAFNSTKGKLKITRNDGTTYTVPFSNASVTVDGFDSTAPAADLTLVARYTVGAEEYTAPFSVSIFAVEEVVLHRPNKVAYDSHDATLDISGGYITLKGNGGKLSKDVPLTANMVSGFDISKVNKENSPLNQTLTVTYGETTKTYDVKLVYTDISLFNENASKFTSLVWTGNELPTISEADGKLALELIALYLDMSKADQAYISASDALSVARAAMAYGYVTWTDEIEKYSDIFTMTDSGSLSLVCKSYNAVKSSLDALSNTDSPLYAIAPTIIQLSEDFAAQSLISGITFADCIAVEPTTIKNTVAGLKYMVELHEKFAEIDADWASKDIMTYEAKIKGIYSFITESSYADSTASQVYEIVSSWREGNDSFDILYTYYFAKNDMTSVTTLAALRLPGELQQLFNCIAGAFNQIAQISAFNIFDSTGFFYYYYKSIELSEGIKNSENAIINELYTTLPLNGLLGITDNSVVYNFDTLIEYFRTANGGSYQYYSASLLGVPEYTALLELYVDTITKLLDQPGFDTTDAYGEAIKELFNGYVALSPTQQLNFLAVVNAYYNYSYPPLAFDDQGDYAYVISLFNQLINQYMRSQFPTSSMQAAYDNLVLAMEIYAQRASYENWLREFKTRMDSVITAYNAMSNADKAIFDTYLASAYEKYTAIRARYNSTTATDLGEWADTFGALEEAIINLDNAFYLLEQGYPVYNLLFSAFERANNIANYILEYAPDEIKNAYLYEEMYVVPADVSGNEDYYYSYEYMLNLYRGIYIDCLCGFFAENMPNYFDIYTELELAKFLDQTYELVWTFAWKYAWATDPTLTFDAESIAAIMEAFRALNLDQQMLYVVIEGDYGLYYEALIQFISDEFTSNAASVAFKMIELEQIMVYSDPEDATLTDTITKTLTELESLYGALEGEDAESFAALADVYADVVADANEMIAA